MARNGRGWERMLVVFFEFNHFSVVFEVFGDAF
jgi:hypothetical protein